MQNLDSLVLAISFIAGVIDIGCFIYSVIKWIQTSQKRWLIIALILLVFAFVIGVFIGVTRRDIFGRDSREIIVDDFEYAKPDFEVAWETNITSPGGKTYVEIDTQTFAPVAGSSKSLKIETHVPCLPQGHRYQQIQRYWVGGPQDWSASNVLEIWVKGDGVYAEPYGGELSIVLVDDDEEIWQSTQWFQRDSDWPKITIKLVGTGVGDPWEHPEDFVIPPWEEQKAKNKKLDTKAIRAIWIKSLTTREWACGTHPDAQGTKYPDLTIWVDHIVRRP